MFDLEHALAAWRRSLTYRRALDADDLDELERHVRDQVDALVKCGVDPKEAFGRALREMGAHGSVEREYRKVYWGKRQRRCELTDEIGWRLSMLKSFVRIALRNMRRRPGFTFMNVAGLGVGMACCLLIALYVRQETSFDRHHPDHHRIHRVALEIRTPSATRIFANGPATLAPALKSDYPQVQAAVRLWKRDGMLVSRGPGRRYYEDNLFFADPSIFDLFGLPLLYGDAETALSAPETVVISARVASRYFGDENPIGHILAIGDTDYEVTGVLREVHKHSHVTFDFLSSILPVEQRNEWFGNWHLTMFHTYLKLQPHVDPVAFEAEVASTAERYVGDELRQFEQEYRYFFQPIAQIHLNSSLRGELEPPGSVLRVYVFSAVALLLLLIASLNYINLTTAYATARANEVGVRKLVGSGRGQLLWQFVGESVAVAGAALLLAVALAIPSIPLLRTLAGHSIAFAELLHPEMLGGMILLLLITGGLAGLVPAVMLSSLHPLRAVSGRFRSTAAGAGLRKVLVTGQFTVSVILIVGAATAYRQLDFMKQNDLGFDEEQVVVLPTRGAPVAERFEEIKSEWLRDPDVLAAAASSYVPGRGVDNFAVELVGESDRMSQSMYYLFVDFDFVSTYDIDVIAGRALQGDLASHRESAFMINEAGLAAFGWSSPEEAIGKRVKTGFGGREGDIVGVYRDFNYRSLHSRVEPLMLTYVPSRFGHVSLKVRPENIPTTLRRIKETWHRLFPDRPYEYFFLNEDFASQYEADEKTARLMLVFAVLAILIACLGLFGLAAFTARSYTKEIGIRKVLGASVASIVRMLTRDFVRLVLTAVLIGIPLAWIAIHRWLETFAYRTDVPWQVLLAAGAGAVGIALLTVSYQAIKAGVADPVKCLRYE